LHQEIRRRFDNVWTSHNDSVRTSHLFFIQDAPPRGRIGYPKQSGV
jgi:hypothetical protein